MSNIQVIEPKALPIKINVDGTEYVVFYNDSTDRLERFLFSDLESTNNKAVDFSLINDIKYPTTKAVNDQKGIANGLASLDANGKLSPLQIPDIAITDVIVATETTIVDFAVNSGNYTFQQGDVIIIDDAGNVQHYLFKGGDKTDVNEYSAINATQIPISQVVGLQSALDGKLSLTGGTINGGLIVNTNIVNINKLDSNVDGYIQFSGGSVFGRIGTTPENTTNAMFFNTSASKYFFVTKPVDIASLICGAGTFSGELIIDRTITEIDNGSLKAGVTKEWVESKITGAVLDYDVSDRITTTTGSFEDVYTYTIPANTLKVGDILNIRVSGKDTGGSGTRGIEINLPSSGLTSTNPFYSGNTSDFTADIEVVVTSATSFSYNSSVFANKIATSGDNVRRIQANGVSGLGFDITTSNDFVIKLNNPNNGDLTIKTSTIKIN